MTEKTEEAAIEEEEVVETEFVIEETTRSEYIACSYNAIQSVSDIDLGLLSKEDAKRIKRIRRKSIKIIENFINEMYDEIFEDGEEED